MSWYITVCSTANVIVLYKYRVRCKIIMMELYCSPRRPFYRCHTCGSDMVQHQRHVIHALSAIHINMQQLVSPLPGNDDGVYTWLACKFCDQVQFRKNLFSVNLFKPLWPNIFTGLLNHACRDCGLKVPQLERCLCVFISNCFIYLVHCVASLVCHGAKLSHFRQCTPYTKMSKDSLLFSFAKFLELKFYSETYGTRYQGDQSSVCAHSVHKDYVQYFLHKDKLAAFQYVEHTHTHTTHALHTHSHRTHIVVKICKI